MIPSPVELMEVEKRHATRRDRSALHNEVNQRWGLTDTRWAQLVNAALLDGSAYEADPVTAGMLARRARSRRRAGSTLDQSR